MQPVDVSIWNSLKQFTINLLAPRFFNLRLFSRRLFSLKLTQPEYVSILKIFQCATFQSKAFQPKALQPGNVSLCDSYFLIWRFPIFCCLNCFMFALTPPATLIKITVYFIFVVYSLMSLCPSSSCFKHIMWKVKPKCVRPNHQNENN